MAKSKPDSNPRSMRAVEISAIGSARLIDVTVPAPRAGEVLVRVRLAGVCGSDLAAFLGQHPLRMPPLITGHEAAGEVVALGDGVQGLSIGDRVVIEPQIGCGECLHCRAGDYNICRSKRLMGTRPWPGSFAEYLTAPARCVHAIPRTTSPEAAVMIEPFCVAIHALNIAQAAAGASVAILGSGVIGLCLLVALKMKGAGTIICTDRRSLALDHARNLGATLTILAEDDPTEEIRSATDGTGVDVCFVTAHGNGVMRTALFATRNKGRIVLVANFGPATSLDLREVQLKERVIAGTAMYTSRDFREAIASGQDAGQPLSTLITHRLEMDAVPHHLQALSEGTAGSVVKAVVDPNRDSSWWT
jgi:L-iditol 2-dehydrogenase